MDSSRCTALTSAQTGLLCEAAQVRIRKLLKLAHRLDPIDIDIEAVPHVNGCLFYLVFVCSWIAFMAVPHP